jgi:hypothetical protein
MKLKSLGYFDLEISYKVSISFNLLRSEFYDMILVSEMIEIMCDFSEWKFC